MAGFMSHDTYSGQLESPDALDGPVPRPDQFPEDPAESQSYWIREYPIDFDQVEAARVIPKDVDVVVIGSGISGAVAVYQISEARPDLRVSLFEARGICTGATGRNGGHMGRPDCYNMVETAAELGAEETLRLKRAAQKNRHMMIDCIEKLEIAEKVDLRLKGTLVVFETEEEKAKHDRDEVFARENDYTPESYYLSAEETAKRFKLDPALTAHGSAYLERSGTMYPRKFVHELLRIVQKRMPQFTIHPYTPVEAVSKNEGDSSYTVKTSRGVIKTKTVFHATNAYVGSICPELAGQKGVFGCKAHMLGVQPNVSGSTSQLDMGFGYADFWHWILQRPNRGPFLYGLAHAEVLNSYDDRETLPADHEIRGAMKQFLERAFPDQFRDIDLAKDVTYDWTGVQGFTMSGASIVGRLSQDSPGEFVSVGHNGEGMGRCFISSTVATKALLAYLQGERYDVPEWFPRSYLRNL